MTPPVEPLHPGALVWPDVAHALPAMWSPAYGVGSGAFAVRPCGPAWLVQADGVETLIFRRGSDAERQARRMARALALSGDDAAVSVYDRRDVLVGRISYYGCDAGLAPEISRRYPWAR